MHLRAIKRLLLFIAIAVLPAFAQTPPQLDMFGNLTGLSCPASASWINTTVSTGAVTGSLTPQNISLTSVTGVVAGNWLTIDAGAAPAQITAEGLGTVATGTVQYKVTLARGNYIPGTAVLKVNGVPAAYDLGAFALDSSASGDAQRNGLMQTGILVDAGLVTAGASSGNMAAATGGATDATAYPNFMSVQYGDPVPATVHTAVQEFINIVFTSAFATAHNGQAITIDYKYSPSEMFVVPSLTGNQINGVVLMNNHAANAPITQGTWYDAKVTVASVPTWIYCDPLGFGNYDFALYVIAPDSTSSHISDTSNTTVTAAISTTGSPVVVTPASMAGICNLCYVTLDQGTASEETQQASSITGSTFTVTPAKTHAANFTVKGYYYNGVGFGSCTSNGGCTAGLAGTSGGKYFGNVGFWGPMQIVRSRGWGYGMVQGFYDTRATPVATVTGGGTIPWPTADHTNIAKMPFIVTEDVVQASSDAANTKANTAGCGGGIAGANGDTDFNTKNVWTTFNGVTTGADPGALFINSNGFGDIYDLNLYAYLCGTLKSGIGGLTSNHENPWLAMIMEDETDYLNSFTVVKRTGFTSTDGVYEDYGSRKNLLMPYHVSTSANSHNGNFTAFSNNLNNLKSNLISLLTTEYTTIAALNTAWGSSYDNFGTDGTQVTGVALSPLPDGTTTTFTVTLAHAPDRESIQLFASSNGTNSPVLAGDLPGGGKTSGAYTATGTFKGPSSSNVSSSSITYSTGAVSVTFSVAPAASANALTVNYWFGGWGVGHGLADEDGTCPAFSASCATVYGTSPNNIQVDGNAAFQADMVTLLGDMVSYYSSHEITQYRALMPHTLITSGYSTGGHGAPADLVTYQNYCGNVDVLAYSSMDPTNINSGGAGTQGVNPYQYINQYCGDKPQLLWSGNHADTASVMNLRGCNTSFGVADQAARATKYGTWIAQLGVKGTTTNTGTSAGINTWQFEDNYSECTNWGLVSAEDNPYDGVHDTTSGTPELVGNNALAYTPELNNWGDLIDPVRIDIVTQENTLLGAAPPAMFPTVPTGRQPMLVLYDVLYQFLF